LNRKIDFKVFDLARNKDFEKPDEIIANNNFPVVREFSHLPINIYFQCALSLAIVYKLVTRAQLNIDGGKRCAGKKQSGGQNANYIIVIINLCV